MNLTYSARMNNFMATERERRAFAERLNLALETRGVRQYGRATRIREALAQHDVIVSNTSIGRWLKGDHRPSMEHLRLLCDMFNVNLHWLETGHGNMCTEKATDERGSPINITFRQLHILSVAQIPGWLEHGQADSQCVVVAGTFGAAAFVLPLNDNSLAPRICRGSLLIIDPTRPVREDLPMLALVNDSAVLGYPVQRGADLIVEPESNAYPPTTVKPEQAVGPVIGLAPVML